ncbi:hypothetical protein CRYUN_Cryun37aG0038500 [Craigia yunnanensis]
MVGVASRRWGRSGGVGAGLVKNWACGKGLTCLGSGLNNWVLVFLHFVAAAAAWRIPAVAVAELLNQTFDYQHIS